MASASTTGRAKPALCSSAPASRTSANGDTRGPAPPSSAISASNQARRNSFSVCPQHGAEEQPVGLQDIANLEERARQVVDPVQAQIADHHIEAGGRERQEFFVRHGAQPAGAADHGFGQVALDQRLDASPVAEGIGDLAGVTSEVERDGEAAPDVEQAISQSLGDLAEQKVMMIE